MQSKWFATSADDAAKWGETLYSNSNFEIVEIGVPQESLVQMYYVNNPDSIGAAYNVESGFINPQGWAEGSGCGLFSPFRSSYRWS